MRALSMFIHQVKLVPKENIETYSKIRRITDSLYEAEKYIKFYLQKNSASNLKK